MNAAIITSEHGWILQNNLLILHLGHNGSFALHSPNHQNTWLRGVPAVASRAASSTAHLHSPLPQSASIRQSDTRSHNQPASGTCLTLECDLPDAGLRLSSMFLLDDERACLQVQTGVENQAPQPVWIEQVLPVLADRAALPDEAAINASALPDDQHHLRHAISIAGQTSGWACYQQGWQSWSYAGALAPARAAARPYNRSLRAMNQPQFAGETWLFHSWEQTTISEAVTLVGFPQTFPMLLVGFLRAHKQAGQILIDAKGGRLAAVAHAEGTKLEPGETCWSEPVLIGLGAEDELLKHYASMTAHEMQARAARETPTGWCSWYYYFTRVSERDILENLHTLSAHKGELPLRVVQIDDGYQKTVGDWTSINKKFPGGMRQLAFSIREHGFEPGLWLAPFTATANSQFAHEHPDWLLHDQQGRPTFGGRNWGSTLHGLDCTHPQVRDWLQRLFTTIVEDWGYSYLKLDFLYCAALPGLRHRQGATSVQALREGLHTIRSVVGEEVFLLGCGCPLLPAVGLVDAMRISPDVAPHWPARFHGLPVPNSERASIPSATNAIRNSLTRAWMHRTFWINDPDCLLIRDTETNLTHDEIRTLASVIGLTGGMLILSDPLHTLREDRWSLASLLLPPLDQAAQPRSWLAEAWPSIISTKVTRPWGTLTLAGLFNWSNHPQSIRLPFALLGLSQGPYHVCEFWTQRYFGTLSNDVLLSLPPHGAAVLALQPVTECPTLLSTDLHISQGAAEVQRFVFDEATQQLEWEIALKRSAAGSIRLFVPSQLRPGRLTSSAPETSLRPGSQPGEYIIQATIPQQASFSLALETSR